MSPDDLTDWERALRDWVVLSTGLADAKVYWSRDGGARGPAPFVTISVFSLVPQGPGWVTVRDNPDSTGDDGQEIEHVAKTVATGVLRVQCFAVDPEGVAGAALTLRRCVARLPLPASQDVLDVAGVAVTGFAAIQTTDGLVRTTIIEPRAVLDVAIRVVAEASEFGTYIASADVSGEIA